MKTSRLIALVAATALMAMMPPSDNDIGYRGLNLGMTLKEVQKLANDTDWDLDEPLSVSATRYCKMSRPVNLGGPRVDQVSVWIRSYKGKVSEIKIATRPWTDTPRQMQEWAEEMAAAINAKYGEPSERSEVPFMAAGERVRGGNRASTHLIAQWAWESEATRKRPAQDIERIDLLIVNDPFFDVEVRIVDCQVERIIAEQQARTNGGF